MFFKCPYFVEEGEGHEGYQNVLIRGRREGVKVNKDNVFICALFLMASLCESVPLELKFYALNLSRTNWKTFLEIL